MPELPEVETIRRDLQKRVLNKKIRRVNIIDSVILRSSPAEFKKVLVGATIRAVDRRGKALLITLNNGYVLAVQLMMTGQLITDNSIDRHTRLEIVFSDGNVLLYKDQRRFGQLRVVKSLNEFKHLQDLGPEPLEKDFNPVYIAAYIKYRKRPIKTLLLDHTFVAGIGNIYACEILYRARISPLRPACRISKSEAAEIHEQSRVVLKEAIRHRGSSMRNYRDAAGKKGGFKKLIQVYAREGEACLHCDGPVKRIVQAGRSTFYCPLCQK